MTRHLPTASLLLSASLLLLSAMASPGLSAAGQSSSASQSFSSSQTFASGGTVADDDYGKGTHALDQQHWQEAITDFDRVVAAKGKRADAALYWKAYALNKLGRSGLVSATCTQLRSSYPRSTWNHDCSTLLAAAADPGIYAGGAPEASHNGLVRPNPQPNDNGIYIQPQPKNDGTPHGSVHPEMDGESAQQLHQYLDGANGPHYTSPSDAGSNADLKMLALNSILQRDPAQALPTIRVILNGNGSEQLKQRALTALAMSQSADAQALLRDVATGKVAPSEQRKAVQMLGVFQGKRAGDTLADIYRGSPDRSIKRAALSGLFIAGDATRMVDLARNEKDLQLKHDIVAQLALMHDKAATDYMLELLK